jgi:hypothetical protein
MPSTKSIRTIFHKDDPYVGFDFSAKPADTQGWGAGHKIFDVVIGAIRPKLIIEVGSWKGKSALHMAALCQSLELQVEIVCVDTWLGSPGLYIRPNDEYLASLSPRNGYPTIYYTFLGNVMRAGMQDVITPVPLPSNHAAEILKHYKVTADLVYIDAAHDYQSVLADLRNYWDLLGPSGALIGDDYVTAPGVTQAALEFAAEVKKPLYGGLGKFVISRDSDFRLKINLGSALKK